MLVKALLFNDGKGKKKTLLAWIKEEKIVTDLVESKQKHKDRTKKATRKL